MKQSSEKVDYTKDDTKSPGNAKIGLTGAL